MCQVEYYYDGSISLPLQDGDEVTLFQEILTSKLALLADPTNKELAEGNRLPGPDNENQNCTSKK